MKKSLLLFIASILLIGLLSACGTGGEQKNGSGEQKKVLRMGTSADYAPFEYIDTTKGNEIIGFDVDLAKMITKELGYEFEIVDMDFTGLIPALQSGKVDFVLAGMTPTKERKKNVDFSDVYYVARNMIVSKKGSGIKTVEDLKGKTVGVQTGSIQEGEANKIAKKVDMKIESRNRIPELIQEIQAGRFDAAIIEDTVAKGYLKNSNGKLEGHTIPTSEQEAGSAIAFPKGSKLRDEFNKVLQEKMKNGEVDKLIKKWFDQ
ncbi:transporter substrate-binding domain-containing protein [Parageobacillus toebii NBRC 107807]|uniref:Polar amino acid transport system substrate-binding protein n=1 Tax=Parageobacillus toebii NBRC 107807 TaxID=1223503 RepID=A0A6G9J787_9BACL|nr:transporter substrate-binding domain-containing protein [Parageobacillus toebii]MBB3867357.1 polar amino acid transport system substrate-binding protein [Parageobacillus toebii NBRC 107807]MED4969828.1 transporter substrate-binding domain-containing protein [Parageobacillus toebii]QIQ34107.1 transporter substrate-binding domain-containing protein [Parageobacillus toebii NBRC 107807]QSB50151.1 transporter substrate-binding domain-containing protein [Parageobacillus toebii]